MEEREREGASLVIRDVRLKIVGNGDRRGGEVGCAAQPREGNADK
jgi:hypothetical protein